MVDDAFHLPEDDGPDPHQLAFAAYEDAWRVRDATGDGSTRHLVDALRARQVPTSMWADGSPLHRALFDSWERGRRPGRMHLVILRYRAGRIPAGLTELIGLFRESNPEHLRFPKEHKRVSRSGRGTDDEVELEFSPTSTLRARLPGWFDEMRDDDDDDHVIATVWLDVSSSSSPTRVPVMLGPELIGHTSISAKEHHDLASATTRKGRRIVADGTIDIETDESGRPHVTCLAAYLINQDE